MFLSMLTCKETLARLEDYLDRELASGEVKQVERHLRICHHCSQIYATEAAFLVELKSKVQRVETEDAQVISLLNRIKAALPEETAK
jgi:predicted anti-sigma-YlaC factor YlaD